MKFFNRKRNQIMFTPADLLKGVGGEETQSKDVLVEDNEEHGNHLPVPGEVDKDLPGGV